MGGVAVSKGRRGNHEGNIRQRADGRWEARVTLADGAAKSFYGKTHAEARVKLTEALRAIDTGAPIVRDERLTVGRYLDDWLERKRPSVKPLTWVRYQGLLKHVIHAYGEKQVTKLSAAQLERLYAELMAPAAGGRRLSPTTVHHIHTLLHQALADAERLGLVARNVAQRRSGAKPPSVQQVEMRTLDLEQARTLLAAARGDRLEALYTLAITTGMREGELLALRWRDVDLEAGHVQVRGTLARIPHKGHHTGSPKSKRSRRRLDLDLVVIAALRRHKARQAEEKLASGIGAAWGDARWPDLVFTNEVGRCLDASNLVKHRFYPLLRRAELPRIRFHDLRHTAATLMLLKGVSAKVVSERLGHSSVAFTMDRYAHVLPSMQREAAEVMGEVLFGG
jgi:integrase